MNKKLDALHNDVSPNYYDVGYKKNFLQKYWHTKRIHEIRKILQSNLGDILDIGCHSGFLTKHILHNKNYTSLTGIDISQKAIMRARRRFPKGTFHTGDAHTLPYKTNVFATIFCFEMLEHVDNPKKVLTEMRRVTKKNGTVYLLVPTDTLLFRVIWKVWNIARPVWKHTHVQSFQSNTLPHLVEQTGFIIEKQQRFNLNMLLLIKAKKIK